jgi:hypothetical protein
LGVSSDFGASVPPFSDDHGSFVESVSRVSIEAIFAFGSASDFPNSILSATSSIKANNFFQ